MHITKDGKFFTEAECEAWFAKQATCKHERQKYVEGDIMEWNECLDCGLIDPPNPPRRNKND